MNLIELATLYRVLNLISHHAHNLAKGNSFFEDHAFFAEVYNFADNAYDECIERHIGTIGDSVSLKDILKDSLGLISQADSNYFPIIRKIAEELVRCIDEMCKSSKYSEGTKNMIQGQSDSLEVFIYKIKRRTI